MANEMAEAIIAQARERLGDRLSTNSELAALFTKLEGAIRDVCEAWAKAPRAVIYYGPGDDIRGDGHVYPLDDPGIITREDHMKAVENI